ncbi:MAG TPA: TonB-dependent receptor [Thermoanaerobaculia bacterium]
MRAALVLLLQIVTATNSVTVTTRDDIELRTERDLAEILREVPGVHVSNDTLFTRGANPEHTLYLWNGIELERPSLGAFSTAGVEQLQVARGPFSSIYGSEAMAGVVNVVTVPTKSDLRAVAEIGGDGLRNANVAAAYLAGTQTFSGAIETRDEDDREHHTAHALWRWKPGTFSLGVTARVADYDFGIHEGSERHFAIPIAQTLGRFGYELTLAESRRDDDFNDPDDPEGITEVALESFTRRARLATSTRTPIGTLIVGGELERHEDSDVTNLAANFEDIRRDERSLFVEDRFSHTFGAARVELSAGARWDDYETLGRELSPRAAAAVSIGANKLRGAWGESFRAPSATELFIPFYGNELLEAEHGRAWELGYDRTFGNDAQFSATFFSGEYEDLIIFDLTEQRYLNIGGATTEGLELGFNGRLTPALRAGASYTFLDTNEEDFDRDLLYRPRHSGSVFANYRSGNLDTSVVVLHTGTRADLLPVAPFTRVTNESYTNVDLNLQYHYGRFTPFLKLENLTGADYEETLGSPEAERRISFGVKFFQAFAK